MQIFFRKLKTASSLPVRQWGILIKCWLMMAYIRLRMNFTPFKSWRHWLLNSPNKHIEPLSAAQTKQIKQLRQLINLASRYHLLKANCLPKSLALKWLLQANQIQSEIKLGFCMTDKIFHGHAWLVRGTLVLNDSDDVDQRYPLKQQLTDKPLTH